VKKPQLTELFPFTEKHKITLKEDSVSWEVNNGGRELRQAWNGDNPVADNGNELLAYSA